jgi:hypothetical protein
LRASGPGAIKDRSATLAAAIKRGEVHRSTTGNGEWLEGPPPNLGRSWHRKREEEGVPKYRPDRARPQVAL